MSLNRLRKAIALDRAQGVTLWQVIVAGDALRETLVLFTDDPERICEAFWKANLEAPRWRQRSPADLRTLPVPPDAEDMDEGTILDRVHALPRDCFLTTDELVARGVRTNPFPYEKEMLARHLTMTTSEAPEVPMFGARFAKAGRQDLLRDLAAVARRLSDDELHVVLTIAVRAWVGQTKYGCLRVDGDRRDFRGEGFEEACDAAFYLAAGLLRPRRSASRGRGHTRGAGG